MISRHFLGVDESTLMCRIPTQNKDGKRELTKMSVPLIHPT